MGKEPEPSRAIALAVAASEREIAAFRQVCVDDGYDIAADAAAPDSITVLLIGAGEIEAARRRVQQGARVYSLLVSHDETVLRCRELLERCENILVAPFDATHLSQALRTLHESTWLEPGVYQNIAGRSPQVRELQRTMSIVAKYDAPILICGETGTGKELVARGIHYSSARRNHAFVPVNCGALNDELLLAQLFGYERGAFTDAKRAHRGLVSEAAGGVLFLDEVDSLSLRGQAALLRFLQEQEYRPLGSSTLLKSNVRVLAATNKDLVQLVAQNSFRDDLYYRVHLLDIFVPPLRARVGDVEVLSDYFLASLSARHGTGPKQLHPLTRQWMAQYQWPGNIRELQYFLHRAFVLSRGPTILVPQLKGDPVGVLGTTDGIAAALGEAAAADDVAFQSFNSGKMRALDQFERNYLHQVMSAAKGNVSLAARRAGKERRAFRRLMKKHGIDRRSYESPADAGPAEP